MRLARREFLRRAAGCVALATGWLSRSWAGAKPAAVPEPEAGVFERVLAEALNGQPWAESESVLFEVPQQAENGAIVPVTVESRLPNTSRILIFAEKNPGPLLAQFRFEPGAEAWVSLRLKLNETGPVLAVAESEGRFYGVKKMVRVMMGGCG
ncbi:thiosulfate oxidation carrier protein SoxY [Methylomagnum sp.]